MQLFSQYVNFYRRFVLVGSATGAARRTSPDPRFHLPPNSPQAHVCWCRSSHRHGNTKVCSENGAEKTPRITCGRARTTRLHGRKQQVRSPAAAPATRVRVTGRAGPGRRAGGAGRAASRSHRSRRRRLASLHRKGLRGEKGRGPLREVAA